MPKKRRSQKARHPGPLARNRTAWSFDIVLWRSAYPRRCPLKALRFAHLAWSVASINRLLPAVEDSQVRRLDVCGMLAPRVMEHVRVLAPVVLLAGPASRRRRWRGSRRFALTILSGLNLPALAVALDARMRGPVKPCPQQIRAPVEPSSVAVRRIASAAL